MSSAGKDMKATAIYPATTPQFILHPSRRSVVHSTKGIVACTQPLAAEAGQRILKQGGNAAVSFIPASFLLRLTVTQGRRCGGRYVKSRYTSVPSHFPNDPSQRRR
jgi:gamma-glutamyltranspeptidase / glutathione hydrolase